MAETFYEAGKRALAESKRVRREREMTKPDDIPQDVWEAVGSLMADFQQHQSNVIDGTAEPYPSGHIPMLMARAIMAEREACAAIAEHMLRFADTTSAADKEISTAIRNRSTTEAYEDG